MSKGRFVTGQSFPVDFEEEYREIKKFVGGDGVSKLIRHLLSEWFATQKGILQKNPIGLRYSSSDGKHWTDVIQEVDVKKIKDDLEQINDPKAVGKIFSVAGGIKDLANKRTLELWKIKPLELQE